MLAQVDEAPVALASQRIDVFLAQKAHIVGVFQRIQIGRVGLGFAVIQPDGAHVLLGAVLAFHFLVTA